MGLDGQFNTDARTHTHTHASSSVCVPVDLQVTRVNFLNVQNHRNVHKCPTFSEWREKILHSQVGSSSVVSKGPFQHTHTHTLPSSCLDVD